MPKVTTRSNQVPQVTEAAEVSAEPKKTVVVTKAPTTYLRSPITGLVITPQGVEVDEIEDWVQAQIDSGKAELC